MCAYQVRMGVLHPLGGLIVLVQVHTWPGSRVRGAISHDTMTALIRCTHMHVSVHPSCRHPFSS